MIKFACLLQSTRWWSATYRSPAAKGRECCRQPKICEAAKKFVSVRTSGPPYIYMQRLLVAFGNAEHGRLGLGSALLTAAKVPRVVIDLARVDLQAIAAGTAHSLALSAGGVVYSFGQNTQGQLGHSPDQASIHSPQHVHLPDPVTAVAAGDSHTLALDSAGRVWAWGSNTAGQCGLGQHAGRVIKAPSIVSALSGEPCVAIAAGKYHSMAATRSGAVISWGSGSHGQLGQGFLAHGQHDDCTAGAHSGPPPPPPPGSHICWEPRPVVGLSGVQISVLAAGHHCSAAISSPKGHLYMWGQGSYHQLGIPESCGDVSSPQLIPGLHKLVKVAIGGTQVLAIRRDERTFHWGSDQAGSLGQGSPGVVQPDPALFRLWFSDVACGFAHSAGVASDGKLFTWGWGGSSGEFKRLLLPLHDPQEHSSQVDAIDATFSSSTASQEDPGQPGTSGAQVDDGSSLRVSAQLSLGGGQLGAGNGVSLLKPVLISRLEIELGEVLRQDGGDPFSFQDDSINWGYEKVACGANHTLGLIRVGKAFINSIQSSGRGLWLQDKLQTANLL